MNLNNYYPLKRNIEKHCLEQNPVHGEMFIKDWNLYQWYCVYWVKFNGHNKPSEKVIVERFFGNQYDRDHKIDCWNWGKSARSGFHNAEPEHMLNVPFDEKYMK